MPDILTDNTSNCSIMVKNKILSTQNTFHAYSLFTISRPSTLAAQATKEDDVLLAVHHRRCVIILLLAEKKMFLS